jgi:hypothetical protein
MNRKWTYRQKLRLLLPAFGLALILCYLLAFRLTIREYQQYDRLRQVPVAGDPGDHALAVLEEKKRTLEQLDLLHATDTVVLDRQLLNTLDSCCEAFHLDLKEYKPLPVPDTGGVWTRRVTVEGRFAGALRLVYVLEQKHPLCRVASVDFKKYKDNQDKKNRLSCTLYVQNLVTHEMP